MLSCIILAAVCAAAASDAKSVTISNMKPRLSTNGEIVNAHDGTVRWLQGKDGTFAWYMHAAQYGECADPPHHGCEMTGPTHNTSCGFEPNHNVSTWKSGCFTSFWLDLVPAWLPLVLLKTPPPHTHRTRTISHRP
jgi:hypothetical protein